METSYLSAQAFSGADLLHGPLAMVDHQVPVIAIVPDGVGGRAMNDVLHRLAGRGADVCCIGSADAVAATGLGVTLEPTLEEFHPCWPSFRCNCWPCSWRSGAAKTRMCQEVCPR